MGVMAAASAALASGAVVLGIRSHAPDVYAHISGVAHLPGLISTLLLSAIAPVATHHVIGATKDAFLAKGFGGRDLLKSGPGTSGPIIPESLGLPTSILYCLLMFAYIPFRYGVRDTGEQRSHHDGGWSGDMHGTLGFPHHEVCTASKHRCSMVVSFP